MEGWHTLASSRRGVELRCRAGAPDFGANVPGFREFRVLGWRFGFAGLGVLGLSRAWELEGSESGGLGFRVTA